MTARDFLKLFTPHQSVGMDFEIHTKTTSEHQLLETGLKMASLNKELARPINDYRVEHFEYGIVLSEKAMIEELEKKGIKYI